MSLVIAVYVPEGIVMASDSRQSITAEGKNPDGNEFKIETINSDNVAKTFLLEKQKVGISNFGADLLGGTPMASHIKKFVQEELSEGDDITTIPKKLLRYFRESFSNAHTGIHIVSYKKKGQTSTPYVYYCHIQKGELIRRNEGKMDNPIAYGATWSGQIDVLQGILQPTLIAGPDGKQASINKPPIIWDAMSLQDAIDFSIYAIRTTIDTIRFQARSKNVGGQVDVLVITPDEARWIQKKDLKGENKLG